jgi:hypothetical protein
VARLSHEREDAEDGIVRIHFIAKGQLPDCQPGRILDRHLVAFRVRRQQRYSVSLS